MCEVILKNISKSYGGRTILKSLSYSLEKGAYFVVGGSGTGKTTLLRLISRLEPLDGGECLSRGKMTMVFQEDRLLDNFSALKNIKLVTQKSRDYIMKELKSLGLSECANRPAGLLSGGEKRRLCILRALIEDTDILLLDEAFTGLDAAAKNVTFDYIKSKNIPLIIAVTHDRTDALPFNGKILTLNENKLIENQ